jgi:hypothetical protein
VGLNGRESPRTKAEDRRGEIVQIEGQMVAVSARSPAMTAGLNSPKIRPNVSIRQMRAHRR